MNSGGIFGYYGDEEAPWFMVAQRDVSIGGTDYHGGDFFIGNKDYAYLWWEHDEARLTIAGNVLISGDIVSDNFEYDPVLGILNGYKLEREGGNAYFGGAVISGSSSVGGRLATTIGSAINSSGNFINDLINSNLSTASKQILGDFTFGSSGAIKMITDANNGLWLSPTGILGKKAGVTTFAIGIDGSPTFRGEITGGSININSSWHVDTSGNMWWGNSSTYAGATYRISSEGVANLSGLTVGTNVALGSAVDATGVASIINIDYLNAKGITAGSVAAENITGTYITGKTIRTATSGLRVEVSSSTNGISFYNTSGNLCGTIYGSSIFSSGEIFIDGNTYIDGRTVFTGDVIIQADISAFDITGTSLDINGFADISSYCSIHGVLYMNYQNIRDVADPVNNQDAANKQWVEANFVAK